jgi:TolA-binding protein
VAAVLAGFAVGIYRYSTHQNELAANEALLKLKPALSTAENAVPPDPAAYLRVAEEYAGTAAGDRALFLAAGALFAEGKYAEAHAQFAKFLQASPQSPFAAMAAYGMAAALEAQGKQEEALTSYQNLPVRYPNASILDDAKFALGRIYEAKKQPEQALRAYEELTKAGVMSSVSAEAASRKQAILAQHPELAATNAPAATTTLPLSLSTNIATVPPVVAPTNPPEAAPPNATTPQP